MMKKKFGYIVVFVLVVSLSMHAFCITSYVQDISFSVPGTWYYFAESGSEHFQISNATGSAKVSTYDTSAGIWEYDISDVVLNISTCSLSADRSNEMGRAYGEFFGGATVTFSGKISAVGSSDVLYDGTILVADMVKTDSELWVLSEDYSFMNVLNARVGLNGTNGGLNSGLLLGDTGDSLMIGDMNLGLSFGSFVVPIDDFSQSLSTSQPVFQISAAIPEPATMALMVVGSIVLMRKKK